MTDLVRDTIASLTAALMPQSSTSIPPLGYGVDLVCATDLDPRGAETDPASIESLAQDVFHRVTTPRGSLPAPDESNFGIDLRALLSRGVTQQALRGIGQQVSGEILKDDRVDQCGTVISGSGANYTVTISITPQSSTQAFTLIVAVSDRQALLKEILK